MSYRIHSDVLPIIISSCPTKIRLKESFFRGMRINYTIIYPSGDKMKVEFEDKNMTEVNTIAQKIKSVKTQMLYLEGKKSFDPLDKIEIKKYYENKLQSYNNRKDEIIKNINVISETIIPN